MTNLPIESQPAHPSNYQVGREGHQPLYIVYHLMQGTYRGTAAWFARARANPSSAHYGVSRDGAVAQYVEDLNMAYSNGIIHNPQRNLIPWITSCQQQGINPNAKTLSIEMEGMQQGDWVTQVGGIETFAPGSIKTWWQPTAPQLDAVIALTRLLIARWAIPVDRAHLCRHSDIDNVKKWWCPGLGFPLATVLHAVGR